MYMYIYQYVICVMYHDVCVYIHIYSSAYVLIYLYYVFDILSYICNAALYATIYVNIVKPQALTLHPTRSPAPRASVA